MLDDRTARQGQAAPSIIVKAMAPSLTHVLMASRRWSMASMLTVGSTTDCRHFGPGKWHQQPGPVEAAVPRSPRASVAFGPYPCQSNLLTNSGFIVESDFNRFAGRALAERLAGQLAKLDLKVSDGGKKPTSVPDKIS